MLQQLKRKLGKPSSIVGVSVNILSAEEYSLSYCVVEIKKGKALIVSHGETTLVSELKGLIPGDSAIVIALDGRGVLHKPFGKELTGKSSDALALQLIPNINTSDFYLQSFESLKEGVLSVMRKDSAAQFLSDLQSAGYSVVAVSLGKMAILNFTEFAVVKVDAGSLLDRQDFLLNNNPEVKVDQVGLSANQFIAFCHVMDFYLDNLASVEDAELYSFQEEFGEKLFFKKVGMAFLVIIFSVLLLNFIFLQYQAGINSELVDREGATGVDAHLQNLEEGLNKKEQFLKQVGWDETDFLAYYADQIGASVPNGIKLTDMQLNREDDSKSKELRYLVFEPGIISIQGESKTAIDVNNWVKVIENKEWVAKATVESYKFDMKDKVGIFEIRLKVR